MNYRLLSSIVFLISLLAGTAISQENANKVNEEVVTNVDLLKKAKSADFSTEFIAVIYEDVKNTYYAIDNEKIESRYIKIRIIQQTFQDNKIVNIGAQLESGYILFLVNNYVKGNNNEIIELFNSYFIKASEEESSMTEDEIMEWMNINDKYISK